MSWNRRRRKRRSWRRRRSWRSWSWRKRRSKSWRRRKRRSKNRGEEGEGGTCSWGRWGRSQGRKMRKRGGKRELKKEAG